MTAVSKKNDRSRTRDLHRAVRFVGPSDPLGYRLRHRQPARGEPADCTRRLVGRPRPVVRHARSSAIQSVGYCLGPGRRCSTALSGETFDFICCQFAFHHLPDKPRMLREVFTLLRSGGRFVMRDLCPQEHPDWLYYEYFPDAQTMDLADFWPLDTIVDNADHRVCRDHSHARAHAV